MVVELLEKEDELTEQKIIKTLNWELPEESLEGWVPYSAIIDYRLFLGPDIAYAGGKGLSLHKDLMGGIHGARGAGKTELLSFLLAKKLRAGKPVWTNYPIVFYVREANGELTPYESHPLDFDKFYAFSREVRNGAVGITELQYYVESRTSGRQQNRIMGYQIMQIRKTALSFLYDVQDRGWVDKRFGWSNDFDVESADIAKMGYDRSSVHSFPPKALERGALREGAYVRFFVEDTSGVLTGTPFRKNRREYGPYQFAGWQFWNIYPTHFIVDVYEAVHSYKKKAEKAEEMDALANALETAINQALADGIYEVPASDLWESTRSILGAEFANNQAGKILSSWDIPVRQLGKAGKYKGKMAYNIGALLEEKAT
jgi:hypothetical protein